MYFFSNSICLCVFPKFEFQSLLFWLAGKSEKLDWESQAAQLQLEYVSLGVALLSRQVSGFCWLYRGYRWYLLKRREIRSVLFPWPFRAHRHILRFEVCVATNWEDGRRMTRGPKFLIDIAAEELMINLWACMWKLKVLFILATYPTTIEGLVTVAVLNGSVDRIHLSGTLIRGVLILAESVLQRPFNNKNNWNRWDNKIDPRSSRSRLRNKWKGMRMKDEVKGKRTRGFRISNGV